MPSKPKRSLPIELSSFPPEEVAAALAEQAKVRAILGQARGRLKAGEPTSELVGERAAFMANMRDASENMLAALIKRKELLTKEELSAGIASRQWVNYAIKTGRLFSVRAADGVEYFPSFFLGPLAHRRSLGRVTQVLSGLPGPSILHFFKSPSTMLGKTPLDSLAEGELKEVLVAAAGFATR
ncbi:MAG: hypothetical protein ACXW2W_05490 [Telluria sp.]